MVDFDLGLNEWLLWKQEKSLGLHFIHKKFTFSNPSSNWPLYKAILSGSSFRDICSSLSSFYIIGTSLLIFI